MRKKKFAEIYEMLYSSQMTREQIVYCLFDVLTEYAQPDFSNGLCKEHLTLWLVNYLKYLWKTMSRLRAKFAETPPPLFDSKGLARVMKALYGEHRQAVRYFLNAINQKIPDKRIIDTLKHIVTIGEDPEPDQDAQSVTFEIREAVILRLIDCRDDIPPTQIFKNLFEVVIELRNIMPILYGQNLDQINILQIHNLLTLNQNIIDVVRRKIEDLDVIVGTPSKRSTYPLQIQMSSLTPTSINEIVPLFTENDEIQHPTMDLNELLLRIQSLA
jgi:hypothetical protein